MGKLKYLFDLNTLNVHMETPRNQSDQDEKCGMENDYCPE
jgi:hypothetical protein